MHESTSAGLRPRAWKMNFRIEAASGVEEEKEEIWEEVASVVLSSDKAKRPKKHTTRSARECAILVDLCFVGCVLDLAGSGGEVKFRNALNTFTDVMRNGGKLEGRCPEKREGPQSNSRKAGHRKESLQIDRYS